MNYSERPIVVIVQVPVVAIEVRPVVKTPKPQGIYSQLTKYHHGFIVRNLLNVAIEFYGLKQILIMH